MDHYWISKFSCRIHTLWWCNTFPANKTIIFCLILHCDLIRTWKSHWNHQILGSILIWHQNRTLADLIWSGQRSGSEYYCRTHYSNTMGNQYPVRNKHAHCTCFTNPLQYIIRSHHISTPFCNHFHPRIFCIPVPIIIPSLLNNLKQNGMNKTNIPTYTPTIFNDKYRKYILSIVDLNHLFTWLLASTSIPIPSLPRTKHISSINII